MGRFTILLAVAAISFTGVALSAAGDRGGGVTLCAAKKGGELTLGSKGKCSKGEKKVTIAKQGPQGEQGPSGQNGTTASIQPESPIAVAEARPAAQGSCSTAPGTFCGAPDTVHWTNLPGALGGDGQPPVGFQKDAAGYVHLFGHLWASGGTANPDTARVYYLPPGYRPPGDVQFPVSGCDVSSPSEGVKIEPDGGIVVTADCLTFDGIEFHP